MAAQREWFEKDYYKILGVSKSASDKDITRAYRKLAKKHHPDANPGSEEQFKQISAAYDVLGDPAKRKEYDEVRQLGPMAAGFGGPSGGFGGAGPRPGGARTRAGDGSAGFGFDDFGDLLGGIFGRSKGARTQAGPRRGDDLEAELHLSFDDAIRGVTTSVTVMSEAPCPTCNGTGAAPGTSPVICSNCGGRGVMAENQGFFSFSQPCPLCHGTGMRVESPCKTCAGSGVQRRPRQVAVRIPPGVDDGQRIRVKARGGMGDNGGPPGDLFVVVHVAANPIFGRRGSDVLLNVPLTFPEAALGATVTVPTLSEPVTLKIPPGTKSGKVFRVRGKGVPKRNGSGDLLVTVEISVPETLSNEERSAVEAFAKASKFSPREHLKT